MKNKINYILEITLTFFLFLLSVIIILMIIMQDKVILKVMDNSKYYDKTLEIINEEIESNVFNDDIKGEYQAFFSKDLIKKDVIKNLNNEKISHFNDLYLIMDKYTDDAEIINTYAQNINNIYLSNYFPKTEYHLMTSIFFSNLVQIIIIVICLFTLILTIIIISFKGSLKRVFLSNIFLKVIISLLLIIMKVGYANINFEIFLNCIFNLFGSILFLSIIIDIMFYIVILKGSKILLINH